MQLEVETNVLHEQIRKFLNLQRMLSTSIFQLVWKNTNDKEKEEALKLINERKYEQLKDWVKKVRNKDLDTKTVRELRTMASFLRINRYGHLQKHELLREIKEIYGNGR